MDVMKRLLFLSCCAAACLAAADLSGVRTVYVMPMARGFDQYLASRITREGVFQIVTDPKLADAVLSDRIGQHLQAQLENFFPTPEPEPEPSAAPAKSDKSEKSEKSDKPAKASTDSDTSIAAGLAETANKLESPAQNSSFGRSRGNIFLVEAKSRLVLWSIYDPPRSNAARDLNRTAEDVVSRLKKDLAPKKK
jgi:hypothetical protein